MTCLLLYATFCIAFAGLNAYLINKGKRIYHALNGAIHLICIGLIWYFYGWKLGVAAFPVARVFFDWSLNLFRGYALGYVPIAPKSIIDKGEKLIFGMNGILPKVIYLAIAAALIIWYVVS